VTGEGGVKQVKLPTVPTVGKPNKKIFSTLLPQASAPQLERDRKDY
jgi:hypothetical protein